MGWNQVLQERPHPLWAGIADDSRFYFVHSYYPAPADRARRAATLRIRRALYLRRGAG